MMVLRCPAVAAAGCTPAGLARAGRPAPLPSMSGHRRAPTGGRRAAALTPPAASADPAVTATKWWDAHPALPNLRTVEGLDTLLGELQAAGDALVIMDVYGTWCGACRAVFPKFVKLAEAHPDVVFLKLPFDENKAIAKALGVKALPAFCAFRGSDGHLESFTAGPSKAGVLAAAVERHNSPRCQLGGPAGSPALTALAAQRRAGAEAALAAASGAGVA